MPRNNSPERRAQRQRTAESNEERRKAERGDMQRKYDNEVFTVLLATKKILDDEGNSLNIPEIDRQNRHQCGNPDNCRLRSAKACSALNQNMPPHLIVGQMS